MPAVRSFFLAGPAGRLEAVLNTGAANATHAALVCHPHPLFGGTMHNKVVFHTMKALNGFGFPVLRFNFRGTGLSAGEHDAGRGEIEDVRAALDWLDREFRLPIIFAGFSFGAATGLRAACSDFTPTGANPASAGDPDFTPTRANPASAGDPDHHVVALISVGTPVRAAERDYSYGFLRNCTKPKLFVSGGRDPFAPREHLQALVAGLPEPKQLILIDDADHFFEGHLQELRQTVENWIRDNFAVS